MFPNLPTDNLYKFVFVGGILASIVFYVTLGNKVDSFESARKDILIEQLKIESDKIALTSEINLVNDLIKSTKDSSAKAMMSDKKQDLQKRYRDFKFLAEKHSIDVQDFTRLQSNLNSYRQVSYIGIAVSLLLVIAFGAIWYCKLQRIEDEIVVLRKEKLKQELNNSNN